MPEHCSLQSSSRWSSFQLHNNSEIYCADLNGVEKGLSYFLKDNSVLSFLSGETLSAVDFGSLLCDTTVLRFLGGILVFG